RLEDEDGIDGPFERAVRRVMREDRQSLTAETITDAQIRRLREFNLRLYWRGDRSRWELINLCRLALKGQRDARQRCADWMNESRRIAGRAGGPLAMLAPATKYRAVYRRLETDSELRARLIAVIGASPIVYVSGTSLDDVAWR